MYLIFYVIEQAQCSMLNTKYILNADGSYNSGKILDLVVKFKANPLQAQVIVMPKEKSWSQFRLYLNYPYHVALIYDGEGYGWSVFTAQLLEQQRILNKLQRPFHEYCVKQNLFLKYLSMVQPDIVNGIALLIWQFHAEKPARIEINSNYLEKQFVINDEGWIACKICHNYKHNPIFKCTEYTTAMMIEHLQSEIHLKCLQMIKSKNVQFKPFIN